MLVKNGDYKCTLRTIKPCVVEGRKNTIKSTAAPHTSYVTWIHPENASESVHRTGVENEGCVCSAPSCSSHHSVSGRFGAPLSAGQSLSDWPSSWAQWGLSHPEMGLFATGLASQLKTWVTLAVPAPPAPSHTNRGEIPLHQVDTNGAKGKQPTCAPKWHQSYTEKADHALKDVCNSVSIFLF